MLYTCERCGYETSAKSSMQTHLTKKKQCPSILADIDRNELFDKLNSRNSLQCTFCKQIFKNAPAKCRHLKICKEKPNDDTVGITELLSEIQKLKSEIALLKEKDKDNNKCRNASTNNNIQQQNNIQNMTNYNITLNNFCDENLDHISAKLIASCIVERDLPRLLAQIHFDPEHPENHTIKMKNSNKKLINYHEDGMWKIGNCDKVFEDMINSSGYRVLRAFYNNNHHMVTQEAEEYVGEDSARKLLGEVDKWFHKIENEDEKTFKELKNQLFLVVLNGTAVICQRNS